MGNFHSASSGKPNFDKATVIDGLVRSMTVSIVDYAFGFFTLELPAGSAMGRDTNSKLVLNCGNRRRLSYVAIR